MAVVVSKVLFGMAATWAVVLAALPVGAGLPSMPSQSRAAQAQGTGRVEVSAAAATKRMVGVEHFEGLVSLVQHKKTRSHHKATLTGHDEPFREDVEHAPRHSVKALQSRDGEQVVQNQTSENPKDASWFGAFAEGESTYNEDADGIANIRDSENPSAPYRDGWEPDIVNPYTKQAVDPAFFHESPGGDTAWQTHYPAATGGIATNKHYKPGDWTQGQGGGWSQEYKSNADMRHKSSKLPAGWFDSSVDQYDGFGREKLPGAGTGARLAGEGWKEQAVNTTMTCKEPGCMANATLQAFEWIGERAARCSLSVFLHPTDFDGDFSGEVVEGIWVNDQPVSVNCAPGLSGCNPATGKSLYPCVAEVPLANIMPILGTLKIAAKISEAVDECPYEGNMLSAVPVVTCMVSEKDPSPLYDGKLKNYPWADAPADDSIVTVVGAAPAGTGVAGAAAGATNGSNGAVVVGANGSTAANTNGNAGAANATGASGAAGLSAAATSNGGPGQVTTINQTSKTLSAVSPLKCVERGCEASVSVEGLLMAGAVSSCKLTVKVNQTDYDGDHSTEVIEYVNVSDKSIATDVKPGKNPCIAELSGSPLSADDLEYTVVDAQDVTTEAKESGSFVVTAKNSPMVDECPSQGNLLDGLVFVDCQLA